MQNGVHTDRRELLDLLDERFDLEEFRALCFQLGIKYDNLGGEGLRAKMLALLEMFVRRGKLRALVEAVQEIRPDLNLIPLQEDEHPGAPPRQLFVAFISALRPDTLAGMVSRLPIISHLRAETGAPGAAPATKTTDVGVAAAGQVPPDGLLQETWADGIALATFDDPTTLLNHVLMIAREAAGRDGARLRIGLYSDMVKVASAARGRQKIPLAAVGLARRVMNLGDDGHILASRLVAEYLEQTEWGRLFEETGKYEVKPRTFVEVYNLYDKVDHEFGNPARPTPKPPEQVLQKVNFPKVLRCSRTEKFTLLFCPHVSYAKVYFQVSSDNIRITCNNQEGDDNTFEFDFVNRSDSLKQTLEVAAKQIDADSMELIRVYCYEENGELTSPPVHRWLKLTPRVKPPDKVYDVVRLFLWLRDIFVCWPLWGQLAVLPATLLLAYFLLPVFLPAAWKDRIVRKWEEVLIATYWPERAEAWEDPIELDQKKQWIKRDDWAFTGLQAEPQEVPPVPVEGVEPEGGEAGGRTEPTEEEEDIADAAILLRGEGTGVYSKLGGGLAFYDFDMKFRVKFIKGNAARWIIRADAADKTWYEFELVKDGGRLYLNGYANSGSDRERLKGGGVDIPVGRCCRPEDEFIISAKVRRYQFSYCVSLQPRPLREDDDRTSVGKDWEAGVFEDQRRFGRLRHGNVGVLGRNDRGEGAGRTEGDVVLLHDWQITKPDTTPFCTAK
ncbi:MAG TPA: hypothetical protein VF297_03800 [Pyrinomonadaceae bacterium]